MNRTDRTRTNQPVAGQTGNAGYLLASVLMITVALTVLSFALFEAVNTSRASLLLQWHKSLASDAAQSGIEFAYDKIATAPGYTGTNAPQVCNSNDSTLSPYLINSGGICTTFKVEEVADGKFVSTGYVYRLSGASIAKVVQIQQTAYIDAALTAAPGSGGSGGPLAQSEMLFANSGGSTEWGTGPYTPAATFTPAGGSLIVANIVADEMCYAFNLSANATEITISGGGLTWTPIIGRSRLDGGNTCDIATRSFYAIIPSTAPTNMSVTVDAGAGRMWSYAVHVAQFTHYNTTTPVVGAAASGRQSAGGTSWSLAIPQTPLAGDYVMGVAGLQGQNVATVGNSGYDVRSGWTQLRATTGTPAQGASSQFIGRTGWTTASVQWKYSDPLPYEPQETVYTGFIVKHDGTTGGSAQPGDVGAWFSSSAPPAREGHASVIHNGYMYMLGGCDDTGVPRNTAYYAPINTNGTTGIWKSTTAIPFSSCHAAATTYNGRLYVQGGNAGYANTAYASLNADGTLGTWATSSSSTQTGLKGHALLAHNGYMYYIGGRWNDNTNNTNVYRRTIDGTTGALSGVTTQNAWIALQPSETNLYCTPALMLNNRIYVQDANYIRVASIDGTGALGTPSLQSMPPVSGGASYCGGLVASAANRLYYWGGYNGTTVSDAGYKADVNSTTGAVGTWTNLLTNRLPSRRQSGSLMFYSNRLYFVNGTSAVNVFDDTTYSSLWYASVQP